MPQKLPIGIDSFEKLRRNGYHYIDKSLLIRNLIDTMAEATLFARPRRFGKTLNMSMLQAFFEKTESNKRDLFSGLAIESAGASHWAHHGKYPVISLSLKEIEGRDYATACHRAIEVIGAEVRRHRYLLDSDRLDEIDKKALADLLSLDATSSYLENGLRLLAGLLERHHQEKVVILIDEYDVPLDKAYMNGYYSEMVSFLRIFLGRALKSNPSLAFAVLTGCLRISRESIFTGLNNLRVVSIRDQGFSEHFGFSPSEVEDLLRVYGHPDRLSEAREWYDGYWFGNAEVYNPWDLVNYCQALLDNPQTEPKAFWTNTSSNDIIRRFVEKASASTQREIERLIAGDTVEKPIYEEITYGEIDDRPENLWSFLFLTGYLTPAEVDNGQSTLKLRIPNREIQGIYIEKIRHWFEDRVRALDLSELYQAIFDGDTEAIEQQLQRLLLSTISYHDAQEGYYHGFLTGVLKGCASWSVSSNQEAGHGRSDIALEGTDGIRAAVIEVKYVGSLKEMETASQVALRQIDEKAYTAPFVENGFSTIRKIGIAFFGKRCRVQCELA